VTSGFRRDEQGNTNQYSEADAITRRIVQFRVNNEVKGCGERYNIEAFA